MSPDTATDTNVTGATVTVSPGADTTPLLTVDAIAKMTTVWKTFKTFFEDQPDSVWALTQEKYHRDMSGITVPDMDSIAAHYPTVAAALSKVHLTPQAYIDFARAVGVAQMSTFSSMKLSGVLEANRQFVARHPHETASDQVGDIGFEL